MTFQAEGKGLGRRACQLREIPTHRDGTTSKKPAECFALHVHNRWYYQVRCNEGVAFTLIATIIAADLER